MFEKIKIMIIIFIATLNLRFHVLNNESKMK
jgi:hypothetical protein